MPIYIRSFYIQKLIDVKEEEKKQMDKANKNPTSSVHRSNIPRR